MNNSKRLYGFIAGCTLLIILAWAFAIRPTVNLSSESESLKERLKINANIDKEIGHLQNLLAPLKEKGNTVDWEAYNPFALSEITKSCKETKVRIIEFKPSLFQEYQEYRAHLFEIELEGSYVRLTKTLRSLEGKTDLGEIISSKYFIYKNRRTKKETIRLLIYLQKLESKKTSNEK